jgi:hypothetical protein
MAQDELAAWDIDKGITDPVLSCAAPNGVPSSHARILKFCPLVGANTGIPGSVVF